MYPSPENQISFIDNLNDIDCPLNDTNSLSSFFILKESLNLKFEYSYNSKYISSIYTKKIVRT